MGVLNYAIEEKLLCIALKLYFILPIMTVRG